MKFNKAALIAAIDKARELEEAARFEVARLNDAKRREEVAAWLEVNRERWTKATKAINAKLRKGLPVLETDVPRDRHGYSGMAFFRFGRPEPLPVVATELEGLRQTLAAIADESVTTGALRDLGVSITTMRKIVPLLGAATVMSERAKREGA